MKLNKRTGFFVIGAILLLCSLVLFYYSMFVSHMASYNVHRELNVVCGIAIYSRECHAKVRCLVDFDAGMVSRSELKKS